MKKNELIIMRRSLDDMFLALVTMRDAIADRESLTGTECYALNRYESGLVSYNLAKDSLHRLEKGK